MDSGNDKLFRENYKLKKENSDMRDFVAKKVEIKKTYKIIQNN